jgi:antitoxin (DNA-binding transcriptional repressor) of toxin-antitoxin stability system
VITVNMHEAKTRLSELVKAVEERNETVILCRDGHEVAEIRRRTHRRRAMRDMTPDPRLRVEFAQGYDSTEPLSEEEWPAGLRLNVSLDTCTLLALARGTLPTNAFARHTHQR